MNDMTMLPTAAQEREGFLRELRVHWTWHRATAAEMEYLAWLVENGTPVSQARLSLAELYGTAEGAAEERS